MSKLALPKPGRVMLGMSGGVDSSVAAWLLQEQGWQVQAVFMQNWHSDGDSSCTASADLSFARAVCDQLAIPLRTVDFSEAYWKHVFRYFLESYARGYTPNPDVLCNNEIKFKAFLDYANEQGVPYIATGHYVTRSYQVDSPILLYRGMDTTKDQSYFLHGLNQRQLSSSLFPLGEMHKSQVRALAKRIGLPNHDKRDSTGICFIEPKQFNAFLKHYLLAKPGEIKTTDGKVIGQHRGLIFHTIGQRKGLGIGGQRNIKQGAWYVVGKDTATQSLIVGQADDPALYSSSLRCSQLHWISGELPAKQALACTAKIRYRQTDQPCTIELKKDGDTYCVYFEKPMWAVTPGQFVVFYDKQVCLGGGMICTGHEEGASPL